MGLQPKISIVTPVYNGLPYLKECVDSVLGQEFQNWEMIISDDGSTDGSRAYLESLDDARIKVFFQEKNSGIFGNLNFTFSKASARFSQILCQDDFFLNQNSLQTLIDYWGAAPEDVGFVRFNAKDSIKCKLTKFQNEILPVIVKREHSDLFFFLFGNIPGNLSNVSLRTEIVDICGKFNTAFPYTADFDFWSRANNVFSMGIQADSITHVRRHPGVASISLNKKGEIISQKGIIVGRLYHSLIEKYGNYANLFKLHSTVNYDILQRDVALRLLLKGKSDYMKELDRVSKHLDFVFATPVKWLLYFLTFGGRIGRVSSASYLLNKVYNSNK